MDFLSIYTHFGTKLILLAIVLVLMRIAFRRGNSIKRKR